MKFSGKLILTIIGIIFIWLGIWLFLVPKFLSGEFFQNQVNSIAQKTVGLDLRCEGYSVKTSILPVIKIKAAKVTLSNKTDKIEIKDFTVKLNWLKSLFGRITVNKLYANTVNVALNNDYTNFLTQPKTIKFIKNVNVKNVNVISADVRIKNQALIDDLTLKSNGLQAKEINISKRIALTTDTVIYQGERESKIDIDTDIYLPLKLKNIERSSFVADIQNIDLGTGSRILGKLIPEIGAISGVVDINAEKESSSIANMQIYSENFYLKFKNSDLPITHSEPITLQTSALIKNDKIYLNKCKINSKLISASLYGKIDADDIKNPNLSLTFSMDKSDVAEITKLLPPFEDLLPDISLKAFKKNPCGGSALAHVDIVGEALEPNIWGNVLVSDVWLGAPIKNAKKATVKLIFLGDKLSLDVNVPTTKSENVKAKGVFDLYKERRCTLNVKSTPNIDLQTAQTVVNPLQEIVKVDFGPVPIMKILGIGNINIDVSGNKLDPHITGVFNFRNGTVSFLDMPELIIRNGEGSLTFNDTDTYFKTDKAEVNSRPVSIMGNCTLLGKFNYRVKSDFQNLGLIVEQMRGNTLLGEINNYLESLEFIKGYGDISLRIYGEVKTVKDAVFNKNIFADGNIGLNAVTIKLKDIPQQVSNIFGKLSVNNSDITMNLYALLNNSKIYINGKIKDNNADISVKTNRFRVTDGLFALNDGLRNLILTIISDENYNEFLNSLLVNCKAQYTGSINPVNLNKLNLSGNLYSQNKDIKPVEFTLSNAVLKYSPLEIELPSLKLHTQGVLSNLTSKTPMFSGVFNLDKFNLEAFNFNAIKQFYPNMQMLSALERAQGNINFKSTVKNNIVRATTNLDGIKFYEGKQVHEILSGKLNAGGGKVKLENVNARVYEMPVLLNGEMRFNKNILSDYNLKLTTKPNQDFFNEFFNRYTLYPVKMKGDITLNADISGNTSQTDIKSDLKLAKDASLYYMGATVGDNFNTVKLTSDMQLKKNAVKLNNFNYDKIVLSLDNNENIVPMLNINGAVDYTDINAVKFNNLKIKSYLPVDAKIFNIIFGKPFMKEGNFTSDLTLNGTSKYPQILGKLNVTSVNIPLVEANINDINLDFLPRTINITSTGNLVSNRIKMDAVLKNDLTLPLQVETLDANLTHLDINKIIDKIQDIEEAHFKATNSVSSIQISENDIMQPLDYTNFIINNSNISADTILIDNITAQNFKSNMVIGKDKILNIRNFDFDMAEGKVSGNVTHNYNNNDVNLTLNLDHANASQLAETLFNLKGQIKGLSNGKIELSCNAKDEKACLATLKGRGNFDIQDGAIPKLGSLEYLLKAGNLISHGITGLTINGVLDLLSPLKSGEFKTISGDFTINNGVADNVNIYSSGKDLNIYITGNYDISTSVADFQIFGSLSKNITNVFNKVKNLSLNTLIKTIPGVSRTSNSEFDNDIAKIPNSGDENSIYKFFRAVINGDINGTDFVRTFEWIE